MSDITNQTNSELRKMQRRKFQSPDEDDGLQRKNFKEMLNGTLARDVDDYYRQIGITALYQSLCF